MTIIDSHAHTNGGNLGNYKAGLLIGQYARAAMKGKPAKIATGYEVQVPLFVNQGDKIEIDTRTGEYRKRV